MIGLYLAEGHIAEDGARRRICWSFHPTDEPELVEAVRTFWEGCGVKVTVRRLQTATQVSISSRLLAAWLDGVLGVGRSCYDKRIPDQVWSAPDARSEEHTSELQSLMRIAYAVFCLKKTKQN